MNANNKRMKADMSLSENEHNNIILNLESKVEKQDNILNEMFVMVSNITNQLSNVDNQNSLINNITSNKEGIGMFSQLQY